MDAAALRARVTGALKSFSPGQLAVMGMLGLAVLVGGMTFMKWASAPSYSVLFSGLDAKDASEVVTKLKSEGVPYKLVSDGSAIMVPQGKVYDLRLSLSAAGLPKGSVVGYEILNNQGLTTSEFSQQVNYQRAVEGELTRTLMAMRGIDSASIHLAIPKDDLFTDNNEEPTAAVLVKTSGSLGDDAVDSIVHLVASSVPGMKPEAVTVADTNGNVLSNTSGTTGGSNRELKLTQQYQNNLATSANAMLAQVFGAGHAIVRVSAQLNFDEKQTTSDTYDPKSQVAVHQENSSETFKGTEGSAAASTTASGVAGTTTNTGTGTTGTGNGTDYQKSDSNTDFGVNHVVENAKVAPGKLERLSVAVMIDKAVKPAPATAQVESLVGAALGLDPARGDQIVVDTLSFQKSASDPGAAAKAAAGESPMLNYAQTGVGVLILGFVLFVLMRGMRKTKVELIDIPNPQFALAANSGTSPMALGAGGTQNGNALVPATGSTQDQVLTLVDQQPDEVAVLLRSWLGDRR
jgi:flagellar M-ring protein FliF